MDADPVEAALERLYPGVEPTRYGTVRRFADGGPDPIDAFAVYRRADPTPHWHYVTGGFRPFGFEMTMRVARGRADRDAPAWPMNLMQSLARYVFETGNALGPGHTMPTNGPIRRDDPTALDCLAFAADPELSAAGGVAFLQAVGIAEAERVLMRRWDGHAFLALLAERLPLLVTDLSRPSLADDAAFVAEVEAGVARDGSNTNELALPGLGWSVATPADGPPRARVTMGALGVTALTQALPGRVRHGRGLIVSEGDRLILFHPAGDSERPGWAADREGEAEFLAIGVSPAAADALAATLVPSAGEYLVDGLDRLTFAVEPTEIRDSDGNVTETVG